MFTPSLDKVVCIVAGLGVPSLILLLIIGDVGGTIDNFYDDYYRGNILDI